MREASTDTPFTNTQVIENTTIEIHQDRGIIRVYGQHGTPLLNITGLPKPIPEAGAGEQLTIEIREPGAVCNWGPTPTVITGSNPIPHPLEDDPWREQRADTASLLAAAGATTNRGRDQEEASSWTHEILVASS